MRPRETPARRPRAAPGAEPEPEGSPGTSPPGGNEKRPWQRRRCRRRPQCDSGARPRPRALARPKKTVCAHSKSGAFPRNAPGGARESVARGPPSARSPTNRTGLRSDPLRRQIQTLSKTQPKRSLLVRAPSTPERGRRGEARGGRIRAPTGEHSESSRLKVKMKGASRDTCDRSLVES